MGTSSTSVDNGSLGNKNADDDHFDRFASQNEEWIIRLRNLQDDEEEWLRGIQEDAESNDDSSSMDPVAKGHFAATRTILHTARLANLQCASAAYRQRDCGRNSTAEIDRLSLHVQQRFDTERQHNESLIETILRGITLESSNHGKVENDASQSLQPDDDLCASVEVDAFFEDYPECGRTMQINSNYCSDSETHSDSDGDEKYQAASRPRKRQAQSTQDIISMAVEAASEPLETQPDKNTQTRQHEHNPTSSMDHSQQGQQRNAKPLSANNNHGNIDPSSSTVIKNPYANRNDNGYAIDISAPVTNNATTYNNHNNSTHGANSIQNSRLVSHGSNKQSSLLSSDGNRRSGERSSSNNTHHGQIDPNPYRRSLSQNKPQTHNNGYSNSNLYGQEDSNSKDAWRDHRNQTNPFQTAREVALAEETHPHRDPFRNRGGENQSRSQHPYNKPYGNDSQGRNNNPFDNFQDGDATAASGGGPFIPESLKRKFQRPKRGLGSLSQGGTSKVSNNRSHLRPSTNNMINSGSSSHRPAGSNSGGQTDKRKSNESKGGDEEDELPEELQHLDKELVKKIQNEIMESGDTVTFDDIAGLADAKKTVQEVVCWPMKRPDLFTGLRRAPNGLLLYGPPGTGKTLIGKAIAHESGATFFSISSSSLTSKWIGEGEKLVKTLFAVAAYNEPAVIFLDEIDSLLTQRKSTENEASRRIKTEFLVQLDGTGTSGQGRVLIIGATNRPQELDEAARRRFTKRLYIPLPVEADRKVLLGVLLKKNNHELTDADIGTLARDTEGFSGADLKCLCTDAAMGPIRQLGAKAMDIDVNDVPPISYKHFKRSLKGTRPSVAPGDLKQYIEWDESYGSTRHDGEEEEDDD